MYKEVLSGIDGIGIWPTISFVVFFLFFMILAYWVLKSEKNDFEEISNTPLRDNLTPGSQNNKLF